MHRVAVKILPRADPVLRMNLWLNNKTISTSHQRSKFSATRLSSFPKTQDGVNP